MSFSEYYADLVIDPNNLSFWYPKIEGCGIKTPETAIVQVPERIAELFFMEKKGMTTTEIMEEIYAWVKGEFIPSAEKDLVSQGFSAGFWFIKNGGFSNKFKFMDCCVHSAQPMEMTEKIVDINYTALMYGADGITELVARRFIQPAKPVPTIYCGMPMRTETRIFYDFDHHHVVYAVDYWDAAYCEQAISRDPTDALVYKSYYPTVHKRYESIKYKAMALVEAKMANVQGFTGIWSIDLLDNNCMNPEEEPDFYLIDMAVGNRSAYWDKNKVDQYNIQLAAGKEIPWVM